MCTCIRPSSPQHPLLDVRFLYFLQVYAISSSFLQIITPFLFEVYGRQGSLGIPLYDSCQSVYSSTPHIWYSSVLLSGIHQFHFNYNIPSTPSDILVFIFRILSLNIILHIDQFHGSLCCILFSQLVY